MSVLVTGATGFVGSRLVARLAANGERVHALVLNDPEAHRVHAIAPSVTTHVASVLDERAANDVVERVKPERCVHLAWHPINGAYLDAPENVDHLRASLALVRALAFAGCRRIVTVGTCFEYDTTLGPLTETSATLPRFLYSSCKLALGEVAGQMGRVLNFSHAHARLFYLYGPGEHPTRLVASVIRALLRGEEAKTTSGEQIRDFLHVDDAAGALAMLLSGDSTGVVNVGAGTAVRIADVVREAADACERSDLLRLGALPPRPGDPANVSTDASRLHALGWRPTYSLSAGLCDTVRYWRERGV